MSGFFDSYPCFTQGDEVVSNPQRLNLRWSGMIGAQQEALAGKRVMEAGCMDGRWLFAALQAGASHAVGIEESPEWAERASRNLEGLGVPADRYTILSGNFFDHAAKCDYEADTLFVVGFIGMGLRNFAIFDQFRYSSATCMIFDDWVFPGTDPIVRLYPSGAILHTVPSSAALDLFAPSNSLARVDFDYAAVLGLPSDMERSLFDSRRWEAMTLDPIIDYKVGARITARFTKNAFR
jgi:hypothetical protein